jgi:hypothetical protein
MTLPASQRLTASVSDRVIVKTMSRLVILIALLAPAAAAAAPPRRCSVWFAVAGRETADVTGKVASIGPPTQYRDFVVKLDTGLAFHYISDLAVPFAKGDTIRVRYACDGPAHGVTCDAQIADAKNRILVIASSNGDDYSDGWTATPGKIVSTIDSGSTSGTSREHTHELVLTKGKTSVTTRGDHCVSVSLAGVTWYVTGGATTWEGMRPPEGRDGRTYAIVRAAH